MAVLQLNVPVETREPTLLIEGLRSGTRRIQLVVIDAAGLESAPAIATIRVTGGIVLPPVVVNPGPVIVRPVVERAAAPRKTAARKSRTKAPGKEKP
jgi:hypothetical protein